MCQTDKDIDIIAISYPDHLHGEHVKQASLRGKHVVCTKPWATDLSVATDPIESRNVKAGKKKFLLGQSLTIF